jgi:hypothetical protein
MRARQLANVGAGAEAGRAIAWLLVNSHTHNLANIQLAGNAIGDTSRAFPTESQFPHKIETRREPTILQTKENPEEPALSPNSQPMVND